MLVQKARQPTTPVVQVQGVPVAHSSASGGDNTKEGEATSPTVLKNPGMQQYIFPCMSVN